MPQPTGPAPPPPPIRMRRLLLGTVGAQSSSPGRLREVRRRTLFLTRTAAPHSPVPDATAPYHPRPDGCARPDGGRSSSPGRRRHFQPSSKWAQVLHYMG